MNPQNHKQKSFAKITSCSFLAGLNVNKIFFTIIFSLFLFSSLIYYIWAIKVIILIPPLLGALALILLSTRIRTEYVPIYLYVGFLGAAFLISSLVVGRTGNRLYVPMIFIVSTPGIAMILIRGYVYSWGGYLVFYSLASYFFFLILAGVDGRSALTLTSSNGISIAMLVACISLYIILSMENKKIDLIPALFTLTISIWGVGVSGIISSFVLCFGLLLVGIRSKSKFIFIVILCLFVTYLLFDILSNFIINQLFFSKAIENFASKMVVGNAARWPMWTNYYNNLDLFRLIFGVNVVTTPWSEGEENEYNYHNSFIHLHAQTGLMGLLTLVLIIFAIFKFYRTNKIFFILLLTIILRSSTDLIVFFNRFDFIPFFFIFYFIKSSVFRFRLNKPLSTVAVLLRENVKS